MAIFIENRKSENVTPSIISYLSRLPKDLVKTLTFDRGKEFLSYEEIEEALCCVKHIVYDRRGQMKIRIGYYGNFILKV